MLIFFLGYLFKLRTIYNKIKFTTRVDFKLSLLVILALFFIDPLY